MSITAAGKKLQEFATAALLAAVVLAAGAWGLRAHGAPDPLRLTPPQGWSSWAAGYDCVMAPVREQHVIDLVEILKRNQWDKLGWVYMCLDDAMFDAERDANGNLQLDRARFPSGLPWLLDYIHTNGMYLGAYVVVGTKSNCGSAGSLGFWFQDGRFIADAGFDFVKLSFDSGPLTWGPEGTVYDGYREVIRGIRSSTNYMFINASVHDFLPWMPEELNSWHTVPEVGDANGTFPNFLRRLDFTTETAWAVRPGYYMDADFIKFPYSAAETRVEFGMNCLIQGQLLVGRFSDGMLDVVTNAAAIAINQDPLVIPASVVTNDSSGTDQVWAKPYRVKDGSSWAFGFLNRSYSQPSTMNLRFNNLPLSKLVGSVKDIWSGQVLGDFTNSFSATIAPMSLGLYVLTAAKTVDDASLEIALNEVGQVVLSWPAPGSFILQTSAGAESGWTDVPGTETISSTNFAAGDTAQFFRLRPIGK